MAALLAGIGTYGVLARRHAVLMLIGVELLLAAAGLILVTVGQFTPDAHASGAVLTLFIITIAAAEIVVALAVIMAMFRTRGDVDLTGASEPTEPAEHPAGHESGVSQ
nr:NADH-quinone oxidoreductase subunit NuoK [Ornithinimicrobium sp. HY1793]